MRRLLTPLAFGLCAGTALGAPIVYTGALVPGLQHSAVQAESGPWGTPERWDFWTFSVDFQSTASLLVSPLSRDHDVYIAVWYGTEVDTDRYYDMASGSVNTVLVGHADALGFGQADGPGQPASLSFANVYGNGLFTLAVADYVDDTGQGLLPYAVSLAVPEPSTWMLGLVGIAAFAARLRRRPA
ncbi:MAG: PEP-CTERM sorting domain-containing protein [Aquabacterium sp.]